MFCILKILEKKWDYNGTVHQLFIDFKKAYESVKREVLYNILTEFGIPKNFVRLIYCVSAKLRVESVWAGSSVMFSLKASWLVSFFVC